MKITKLTGCGTALITPFTMSYNIDFDCYRKLVKRQIESGIHFLVPLGTTAETPCLNAEEKLALLGVTIDEVNGRIPVIAGIGSNNTEEVITRVIDYDKLAPDGYMVVTPYYNKPTQQGLYTHFSAIAHCTDKPIVMYNVPSRTGTNMTAETTLRLAENSNIIAVKEASSDYTQINEIIRNAPDGFSVISGNDIETLPLCVSGAVGVISVVSNVVPGDMAELMKAISSGRWDEAKKLHQKLTPMFNNCFIESNPIPAKAAMCELGLIENVLRPPLYTATDKTKQIMKETLLALN
ncbi:MAG TPA: 4-hydroxy-tetrahydrodipicolinate synthase [Ignavibacteria bacterium]|nr:4-hydroxy-tetrahydrodipicolinate synthase [Ignavibacteria bacterium]